MTPAEPATLIAVAHTTELLPLSKQLKAGTRRNHDTVDTLVMQARPFESLVRYGYFLRVQHRFHGAISALYDDITLNRLLPGLSELPRFDAVCADISDLGLPLPPPPTAAAPASVHVALGWLYCSEGSNLGAAFLFKQTQQLGLSAYKGARHLTAHPEGRGLHWRQFVALLDGLELSESQREEAVSGAVGAFDFYRAALRELFPAT
ncbi:biliverdin-producing heme oxygenase [Pseudomonas sp. CNPSo 3701]|uniref:biliverdin-producing heme oxygenase n=1 Tax=Pseudomonas sp. CNPSo 3701 TaxID=3027943 RepID=UPI002364A1FD|nr:biliverdin-producing heme oxygenase [Pseudomonas sp. CNPSo 3701]MDD1508894.1 biliverdin-producing heme oxygenase [Pseudomonas sp. CNPSo 3701]